MSQTVLEAELDAGERAAVERGRVLFLVHREGMSPVFSAMVLRPVEQLRRLGWAMSLGLYVPAGQYLRRGAAARWRETQEEIGQEFGGACYRIPSPPTRWPRLWNEARPLSWLLSREFGDKRTIVHCRGARAAAFAGSLKQRFPGLRVIYDMRGLTYAEYLYEQGARGFEDASAEAARQGVAIRENERRAAESADVVIAVSDAMKEAAIDELGADAKRVEVIWNHAETVDYEGAVAARKSTREELGLLDRFVVGYCGSIYGRQLAERGFEVFQAIREAAPGAHYLALTQQGERMRELARQAGVGEGDVTVKTVPYTETARHVAAFDVGLITTGLFEHPTALANRVCCPVKFAEYLASGTPAIMSEGIGGYSELARRERVGLVIPTDAGVDERRGMVREFVEDYLGSREEWRERCREVARRELDSGVHLPKIVEIYERLSQ